MRGNEIREGAPTPIRVPIRLGIADDHPIVRKSLRCVLEREPDMQVAGEAASGRAAIDLVRTTALDVLLLDLHMPGHSGIDALAMIKAKAEAKRSRVAVLALSGSPEHLFAVPLIRNGASGYLTKGCRPEELVAAVRHVAAGRRWLTPAAAELLADQAVPRTPHETAHPEMSTRELQLLMKLARGCSTGEAADQLSLSPSRVSAVRAGLLRKLAARSNSDLTCYAVKHGLLG